MIHEEKGIKTCCNISYDSRCHGNGGSLPQGEDPRQADSRAKEHIRGMRDEMCIRDRYCGDPAEFSQRDTPLSDLQELQTARKRPQKEKGEEA